MVQFVAKNKAQKTPNFLFFRIFSKTEKPKIDSGPKKPKIIFGCKVYSMPSITYLIKKLHACAVLAWKNMLKHC